MRQRAVSVKGVRTCAEAASACCSCCCSCFLRSWTWCSSEQGASAAGWAGAEATRMGELSRREGPSDTCRTRPGGETCGYLPLSRQQLQLESTLFLCLLLARLQLSDNDLDLQTGVLNTFSAFNHKHIWWILAPHFFLLLLVCLPFILFSK